MKNNRIKERERRFKERLLKEKGREYEMIGKYTKMQAKTEFEHSCGYRWETTPDTLLSTKKGCPLCAGNARIDSEEYSLRVTRRTEWEYSVIGEYINARTPTRMKHNKCGFEWEPQPYAFFRLGTRCPKCAVKMKRTSEEFTKLVKELEGSNYEFLEPYINNETKIKCRHNEGCGYEWKITPTQFTDKNARCPKCAGNARITHKEFLQKVSGELKSKIDILGKYTNSKRPIEYRCKICGHIGHKIPYDFYREKPKGCLKCNKLPKHTHEELLEVVEDQGDGMYEVLTEYKDVDTKVKMKHLKCSNEYWVTPYNFTKEDGNRCPYCTRSKGEEKIDKILTSMGVEFIPQQTFEGCINILPLPFDFYIPSANTCIEYDGEQHYQPVNFGGVSAKKAAENLEGVKRRDKIKTEFCENNGINLVRIPYSDTQEELENKVLNIFSQEVTQRDL